jgi:hypothetical protein
MYPSWLLIPFVSTLLLVTVFALIFVILDRFATHMQMNTRNIDVLTSAFNNLSAQVNRLERTRKNRQNDCIEQDLHERVRDVERGIFRFLFEEIERVEEYIMKLSMRLAVAEDAMHNRATILDARCGILFASIESLRNNVNNVIFPCIDLLDQRAREDRERIAVLEGDHEAWRDVVREGEDWVRVMDELAKDVRRLVGEDEEDGDGDEGEDEDEGYGGEEDNYEGEGYGDYAGGRDKDHDNERESDQGYEHWNRQEHGDRNDTHGSQDNNADAEALLAELNEARERFLSASHELEEALHQCAEPTPPPPTRADSPLPFVDDHFAPSVQDEPGRPFTHPFYLIRGEVEAMRTRYCTSDDDPAEGKSRGEGKRCECHQGTRVDPSPGSPTPDPRFPFPGVLDPDAEERDMTRARHLHEEEESMVHDYQNIYGEFGDQQVSQNSSHETRDTADMEAESKMGINEPHSLVVPYQLRPARYNDSESSYESPRNRRVWSPTEEEIPERKSISAQRRSKAKFDSRRITWCDVLGHHAYIIGDDSDSTEDYEEYSSTATRSFSDSSPSPKKRNARTKQRPRSPFYIGKYNFEPDDYEEPPQRSIPRRAAPPVRPRLTHRDIYLQSRASTLRRAQSEIHIRYDESEPKPEPEEPSPYIDLLNDFTNPHIQASRFEMLLSSVLDEIFAYAAFQASCHPDDEYPRIHPGA